MAERVRYRIGGIFGLLEFIREHGEAVEYDCLIHGYRLAEVGVAFSWRDLQVLVRRWGGLAGTATFRSVHGYEGWTTESQLLANVIDSLAVADYHRVKIGGAKSVRKPKPMERPWDKPKVYGRRTSGPAMSYDEMDSWIRSTWTT